MSLDRIGAALEWRLAPELVFTPNLLDFGQLPPNCKKVDELYVTNLTGSIDGCSVVCSPAPVGDRRGAARDAADQGQLRGRRGRDPARVGA